jgi:hypothetical protein
MVQAIIRIIQQFYITKRFYGHDSSLGRQAQAASAEARDMNQKDKKDNKKVKNVIGNFMILNFLAKNTQIKSN